ncbi:hypothetical protein ES332_A09G056200v1 [Gossypium tomentosum]|uniref:Uncharacterized protein n=1 Tax=Gossypium tomentosum TaxID=34277 RepID=A0A5D2NYY2_GOSTO|nr:hypothetical protein ES332_A09G056200v1 [Gossypium tomentosum]
MRPFPYLAITPVPANLVSILKLASKFISINVSPGCFQLEGHRGVSSAKLILKLCALLLRRSPINMTHFPYPFTQSTIACAEVSGLAWQTGHKGLFATLRLYKFE